LNFFGRKREDMLGKTVGQCWPPDVARRYEKDDRQLLEKNQRQSYSVELQNAQGEKRQVLVRKASYRDASGAIAGFIGTMWDYTEQKAAEDRYYNLFTFSPDPVVVHDGKHVLTANQAAINFFQAKDPEKYIGRPIKDFIHPDSFKETQKRVQTIFVTKTANTLTQQKFLTASGEVRDVEAMAVPLDYEGQPAIMTSFRDISEQKQNLDRLHDSENNFRNLVEANPNPVIIHQDDLLVYANQAALDFVGGGELSEFIGENVFSFVSEASRDQAQKNALKIQNEGLSTPVGEQTYLAANGEPRVVESRGVPIIYEGKPSVMVSFLDITDRAAAQRALQESRRQLEMITDNVTYFIVLMDLKLDLLYVNQACLNWFGLNKDLMLGKNLSEFFASQALQATRSNLGKVVQGEISSFHYTFKSKRRGVFEFWSTMIPVLSAEGEVVAVLAQTEDITERETARKDLAENKELLELIIDTIPGLFAYADSEENYLYVNQAYADWYQQDKDGIIGSSFKKVLPSETYRFIQPYLAGIKAGKPQVYSREITRPSGQKRSLDIRYIPHFDQEHKVKAFLTSVQDVTERQLAESHQTALRELASALTKRLDLHKVGKVAAKTIRAISKSDAIVIELYDYDTEMVVNVYSEDTFSGKSKPQQVTSDDLPFSALDTSWLDPNFKAYCLNRSITDLKKKVNTIPFASPRLSRSLVFVPIHGENKIVGLVSVQSYTPDKYSTADIPLLQTFADQIGSALVRAQKDAQLLVHQKDLEQEERKYRALINSAGDAVFVASMRGDIHTVNQHACSTLGYTEVELTGMNLRKIDPQFFRRVNRQKLALLKASESSITIQSEQVRKDDSIFPVELNVSLTEINSKPNILCFVRNITERKITELREQSLRKLAHDLNNSTDMRTVGQFAARAIRSFFDSDAFAIEYFDQEKQVIQGVYSEDTFASEKMPREVPASDTPFSAVRADFFKQNAVTHVRNRSAQQLKALSHHRPFGSDRFSHSLLFAPIVWESDNIGVLTVQSYTDNKYTERDLLNVQTFADQIGGALMRSRKEEELSAKKNELQESEEKYRSIIDNAGDALFVSTLQGEILAFNQHATQSLGYLEQELFELNLQDFTPEFTKQLPLKHLKKMFNDQSSVTIETMHVRKDQSLFPVELRVGTMEMGGKQCVLYFSRDISERKANKVFG
ncbi:MAG: PAS domain S-box protein, partial [Candidatus Marinimicrobia bacterium]|nr:PAS domain S-box protein [Candidatus Neomarinimicrobiota bacterium]